LTDSIQISCPHCGFARETDPARVPNRPVKVNCPQCQQSFAFDKEAEASPADQLPQNENNSARPIPSQTSCPACGLTQSTADRCSGCGVIYARWHQRMDQTVPPAAETEKPLEYAGFWVRLVAYLIDSLIIGAVQLVLTLILTFSVGLLGDFSEQGEAAMGMIVSLFSVALGLGYAVFFTGHCGQTPGKMALRIKVIHIDGSQISYGRAALREIPAKFISGILLGIGYLMVAFDDKKQGLHDRIANTYVIKL